VFAHLANQRALPLIELSARREQAAAYFLGMRLPGVDHTFPELCALFMTMLGADAGSLTQRANWMRTARTWRLLLLLRRPGYWELSESLAFAVAAHGGPLPAQPTRAELRAAAFFKMPMALDPDSEGDQRGKGEGRVQSREGGPEAMRADALFEMAMAQVPDSESAGGGAEAVRSDALFKMVTAQDPDSESGGGGTEAVTDCPLTFSRAAMLHHMPSELLVAVPDTALRERMWATSLALATLQRSPSSWLLSAEEDGEQLTLVDAGHQYLTAQGESNSCIQKLLNDNVLSSAADQALSHWELATQHATQQLRSCKPVTRSSLAAHAQRAGSRVIKSLQTDHETFSVFLDEDSFIMRWQRWMILVTLVLSGLLTSIWFYSSRASLCCAEVRSLLDSGAGQSCSGSSNGTQLAMAGSSELDRRSFLLIDKPQGTPEGCDPATPAGPCLGYTGACGDLTTQFASVQGAYLYGDPGAQSCHVTLGDYVCHAFPDDAYFTDQIFVGLICVAVALPVALFLERAFEVANEVEGAAEGWLAWEGLWRLLLGRTAHQRWAWAEAQPQPSAPPSELVRWLAENDHPGPIVTLAFLLTYTLRRLRGRGCDAPTPEPEQSAAAVARSAALSRRLAASAGLMGVYVAWTIMVWFIFTYGIIIYRNLGPEAEKQFASSWGVGYALDNAKQWSAVLQEALKVALLLVILDLLRVTSHREWLADWVDLASVQVHLLGDTVSSWAKLARMAKSTRRTKG